jgi:hypothetical protein
VALAERIGGRSSRKNRLSGYGAGDPYARGHQLLAELLPPERVVVIEGGHDYLTFKTLWKIFITGAGQAKP